MSALNLTVPVRHIRSAAGFFHWPPAPVLAAAGKEDLLPLGQLADKLRASLKLKPQVVQAAPGPAALRIVRARAGGARESYRLVVREQGVDISATHAAGAYYGLQTLLEMVNLYGRRLPALQMEDEPDFRRRGVYLDCSRGKVPTVATLKALIEQLAHWKINELQLYIENVFTFRQHPEIGRGFDPFTPEEILAVQDHARQHHLRLVPSFSSFGHFERILSLPEYARLGERPGHLGFPGGTTLCPTDPRSVRLLADLYGEFLPLFEADDFNAGCDETWELGKGRSRRRAERMGVGRLYLDFIKQLHRLCRKHGKRMNIWADIVLKHPELVKELPRDVVMLNWDYDPDGPRIPQTRRFPKAGLAFMVCPGTNGWKSHGTRRHTAMENIRVFAAAGRRWGAEGLLNTDWGDFGHRNTLGVSLHGLAHGAAHAWHGRAVDNQAFTDTFCFHFFGKDPKPFARAIRALGASEDRTAPFALYASFTQGLAADRTLYQGLPPLSPLYRAPELRRFSLELVPAGGARRVIADLERLDWSALRSGLPAFPLLAVDDFQLAAEMDRLACRRILAGRRRQAGRRVPAHEIKELVSETKTMSAHFRINWLNRNKPSRLRDNLKMFANGVRELEALVGR